MFRACRRQPANIEANNSPKSSKNPTKAATTYGMTHRHITADHIFNPLHESIVTWNAVYAFCLFVFIIK